MPTRRRYPSHVQAALDAAVEQQDTRPRGDLVDVWLPYPPSVNALYRSIIVKGFVKVVKTRAGTEYAEAVARTLGAHLAQQGVRPPRPYYRLTIQAFPPKDWRKHDLDNLLKAGVDAVFEAIGADDDDVIDLRITKPRPDLQRDGDARIVVTLEGEV